nr:hypothetical protein [Rhodopseudomonas rhenobacensis]
MLAVAMTLIVGGASDALAQKALRSGDVLTGQLNAMRSRAKGKRVATFQVVSEPRRLPAPGGLCNLETGPVTFQLVTTTEAQAAQLKGLIGKQVAVKVGALACAEAAGEISEAVISSWSVVATP